MGTLKGSFLLVFLSFFLYYTFFIVILFFSFSFFPSTVPSLMSFFLSFSLYLYKSSSSVASVTPSSTINTSAVQSIFIFINSSFTTSYFYNSREIPIFGVANDLEITHYLTDRTPSTDSLAFLLDLFLSLLIHTSFNSGEVLLRKTGTAAGAN